jgi:hypothetical protein
VSRPLSSSRSTTASSPGRCAGDHIGPWTVPACIRLIASGGRGCHVRGGWRGEYR